MESEENIENTVAPDKEVEMDENGKSAWSGCFADRRFLDEAGPKLHDKTDLGGEHEHDGVLSEEHNTEVTPENHEESATQDDEPTEAKTQPTGLEEDLLLHPKPEIALENPLLRSVMEITPPTPRDSSPMQAAIDEIHPSKVDEDGHLTSPTERKEEEVQWPTGVCDFSVSPADNDDTKTEEKGNFLSICD
jgi:hypothetical protein